MRTLLLATCFAVWTPGIASPATVSVTSIRDNTLFEDVNGDTSNGAGPVLFAGNNGRNLARRALLAFDVTTRVPAGATIDSVTLVLRVSNSPNDIPRQFTLHRIVGDWGEGTSEATGGVGAPATNGDGTWLHTFYPDQLWSTPGGDFDGSPTASVLVGDVGTYTLRSSAMAADVQGWLDQPSTNHGWLVRGEETLPNTARRFESREAPVPADRPTLTIYYTGTTPVRSVTWSSIKARYR
jgi:hypothetical protein